MPKNNLLPARAVVRDGQPWLEIDDFRLPTTWVPSQPEVMLAARPEDIKILLESEPDAVEFQVYTILPTGPELLIEVRRRNRALMIRETRQLELQMDQKVWLKIDPSALNLYDKASGLLLVEAKPGDRAQT
jgi:ABC-type sugar transport system ATPase subunit